MMALQKFVMLHSWFLLQLQSLVIVLGLGFRVFPGLVCLQMSSFFLSVEESMWFAVKLF
jgi:hypothetical protein